MNRFALGAALAAPVAIVAFRAKSLTAGGAVAAVAVGTVTFGSLGLPGAGVLLTFFVTSVALSRVGRARKRAVLVDIEKATARDAAQVLANGGIAALCAALARAGDVRYANAFAGAFAAAAADTWGTEIGTLARRRPRSILTFRPVATGLSGGVTPLGLYAQCAGALVIALAAKLFMKRRAFVAIALAGLAGAIVDSLLGASLQMLRWCARCERATERETHECGARTTLVRGIAGFGNDWVNLSATCTGALLAFASSTT
jgi:uncharacterized protein (TIGR00297 family)